MTDYPKMRKIHGIRHPQSMTRLGMEIELEQNSARLWRLQEFLYAFDDYFSNGEHSERARQRLEEAYNEIYPQCKAHTRGDYCECPWLDVGWKVNNIQLGD